MDVILGIDGGGTKTICLVADGQGRLLGQGRGGPSNYLKEGLYVAKSSLRQAIQEALRSATVEPDRVKAVCAGLAGMDRAEDRTVMRRVFRDLVPRARLFLVNDAYIALAGATEGRSGVIVISGTGSIALGVNRRGEQARAGGWGYLIGDEGSAFDIARRGLVAAFRDHDGRGPRTSLTERFIREFYLTRIDDLIPLFYTEYVRPSRIAGLFPLVLECAEEGDEVAVSIVERAAGSLFQAAQAVIERLRMGGEGFPVALSGGVLHHGRRLRARFEELLAGDFPKARVVEPRLPAERGALLVAQAALRGKTVFGRMKDEG